MKRTSAAGSEGVPIPDEFLWAHLCLSLEITPAELMALDQAALVLHDYSEGMAIGRTAAREQAALEAGR